MGHHAEPVLLSATHLGLAVSRLRVAAEAVFRVANPVLRHLGEIVVGEPRLQHHRARIDLHSIGMEMLEAFRRRDRQRLRRRGIVRPPGRVHTLARRHDRRDPTVHVRVEKIHRLLPRRVVPQHDMTMRIDQPRNHRRPPTIHDHIRSPGADQRRGAYRGDPPIRNKNRLSLKPRRRQHPRRDLSYVHKPKRRH